MKRLIIAILLVGMLLVTACNNQSVTSTDALLSSVPSEQEQGEGSVVAQPTEVKTENVDEDKAVLETTKPDTAKESTSVGKVVPEKTDDTEHTEDPVASGDAPSDTEENNQVSVGIQKVWPTFTSFSAFENWLAKGGEHQDVYDSMIQNVTNPVDFNEGYYYRPTFKTENDFIMFKDIEFCSNRDLTHTYYRYDIIESKRKIDMQIWVDMDVHDADIRGGLSRCLKQLKVPENEREFDNYLIETYNGIEYYAFYYPSEHSYIYWTQYNKVFCADLYGYFDHLDQILPLLSVERLSYTNDHVTQ